MFATKMSKKPGKSMKNGGFPGVGYKWVCTSVDVLIKNY